MQRQHELIGSAVLERSSRGWAPKQGKSDTLPPASRRPFALTMRVGATAASSPPGLQHQLREALKIRRAFTRLRTRIKALVKEDVGVRLEALDGLLSAMSKWELFHRVRVDEQLRFSLLQEQVIAWLSGSRSPAEAEKIWAEILVFVDYLTEINYRAELLDYDRRVLTWGLAQAESGGVSEEVAKKLSVVFGRDSELDRLLEMGEPRTADDWIQTLRRVLGKLS
jgi:hypothetical protein